MKIVANFRKFHLPPSTEPVVQNSHVDLEFGAVWFASATPSNIQGARNKNLWTSRLVVVYKYQNALVCLKQLKLGCVGRKTENQVKSIKSDRGAFTRSSSVCLAPYSLASKPNEAGIKKNKHPFYQHFVDNRLQFFFFCFG